MCSQKAKVLPGSVRNAFCIARARLPTETGAHRVFCEALVLTTTVWGLLPFIRFHYFTVSAKRNVFFSAPFAENARCTWASASLAAFATLPKNAMLAPVKWHFQLKAIKCLITIPKVSFCAYSVFLEWLIVSPAIVDLHDRTANHHSRVRSSSGCCLCCSTEFNGAQADRQRDTKG